MIGVDLQPIFEMTLPLYRLYYVRFVHEMSFSIFVDLDYLIVLTTVGFFKVISFDPEYLVTEILLMHLHQKHCVTMERCIDVIDYSQISS